MLFQIKDGTNKHFHTDEKFYYPGDQIETDIHLDKAFPSKFVRVDDRSLSKKSNGNTPNREIGETEVSHPKWGIQVTAKFDDAVLLGYDVYYHAGKDGYAILEGPTKLALRKKESDVMKFLKKQAVNVVGVG